MNAIEQELERSEFGIWLRLLDGQDSLLSADAARAILAIKFPAKDVQRLDELAAKARAGTLTDTESQESEAYGRVNSLLSMLKTKARQALKRAPVKRG
jgi:uncharacterized protein YnzC (UPF0291/DUF896 family)